MLWLGFMRGMTSRTLSLTSLWCSFSRGCGTRPSWAAFARVRINDFPFWCGFMPCDACFGAIANLSFAARAATAITGSIALLYKFF